MNLFIEEKQINRHTKQTYGYPRGNMGRKGLISSWNEHTCHYILYRIDNQQRQEFYSIFWDNLYNKRVLKRMNICYI